MKTAQMLLCAIAFCNALPTFGQITLPDVRNNIFMSASATYGFLGNPGLILPSDGDTVKSQPNQQIISTKLFEVPASYTGPKGDNTGFVRVAGHGGLGHVGVIATATGVSADFLLVSSRATAMAADELTFFSPGHTRLKIRTPFKLTGSIEVIEV
jgi:hypothetical protein